MGRKQAGSSSDIFKPVMEMLQTPYGIDEWLNNHGVYHYKLVALPSWDNTPKWAVDVPEDVDLSRQDLSFVPVRFRKVDGSFDCAHNQLTDLSFAPEEVNDSFDCSYNQITSLKGAPSTVDNFFCPHNLLSSLDFAPKKIFEVANVSHNPLKSLIGLPKEVGNLIATNTQITSLEGLPLKIEGTLDISYNSFLSSLDKFDLKEVARIYFLETPLIELANVSSEKSLTLEEILVCKEQYEILKRISPNSSAFPKLTHKI